MGGGAAEHLTLAGSVVPVASDRLSAAVNDPDAEPEGVGLERREDVTPMSRADKTLDRVLRGNADANIRFGDLRHLLLSLDFAERVRGDHHIFTRDGVEEILNLQPIDSKAKPYQVRQVRNVILKYQLAGRSDDVGEEDGTR